jgi:hypothetical protein
MLGGCHSRSQTVPGESFGPHGKVAREVVITEFVVELAEAENGDDVVGEADDELEWRVVIAFA